MLSEFSRDIAEERFQTQTFQPLSMCCFKYEETHNPRWVNPSSVKCYGQENPLLLDFDLPQKKQPFELINTWTNLDQFSENSCQNANNFQTSKIAFLSLRSGQEFKNKEKTFLPGRFTQFRPLSQAKTVGI